MYIKGIPKRFLHILLAIITIILIGTIGFKIIGGSKTTFLDALYMTAITISTVGYGDVIGLDDKPFGKLFTICFIFAGAGTVAYLFTTLAAYIIGGELQRVYRRRNMEKRIEKIKNHYIVCGMGMVGLYIAKELHQTKRHLIAIDMDEETMETLKAQSLNVDMIHGDATENEILEKAMIHRAKGLFATTNSDNDNIVIVLTAKQLNPGLRVISRCNDTKNIDKIRRAGADKVIALNYIGGLRMASEMIRPNVTSFLDIMLREAEAPMRVEEVHVVPHSPYIGKPIAAIDFKSLGNALLISARKSNGEWIYNPSRDTTIEKGMSLLIIGTPEQRMLLQDLVSPEHTNLKA
ncbi:MAG: potassium transporter TrkA [Syntrophus sp. (in: bacteria)]|nr:potassium transporter TrkA [Syntrophus sp. (in: bacteria)]